MDYASTACCALAFLLYYNTLDAGFVYDDRRAILSNPDLLSKTPWTRLLENDFWGTPLNDSGSHGSYRPLCVLTFRLNYLLGGFHPWGYHLVNVLLHCLATILLIQIAKLTLPKQKSKVGSVVAGVIFAAHPIHTETVAGVVGRADLAACNFCFLTILAYIAHVRCRDIVSYAKLCNRSVNKTECKRYQKIVFSFTKNCTHCNWPKKHSKEFEHGDRQVDVTTMCMKVKGKDDGCNNKRRNNLKLWIYLTLSLLLSVAAMLSKETGITVLGLCFVYDIVYSSCRNKTGGGVAEVETFLDYEEQLIAVMVLTVDGLLSENDCDNVLGVSGTCQFNNEVEMVENDFSAHDIVLEEILIQTEDHESNFYVRILEDGNEQFGKIQENSESTNLSQENNMPHIKWNPNILKQEKSKVLRREKRQNKDLQVKLDTLTASKNELIKLQISVAEHELHLFQTKMELKSQKGEKEIENLQMQKNNILSHEQGKWNSMH